MTSPHTEMLAAQKLMTLVGAIPQALPPPHRTNGADSADQSNATPKQREGATVVRRDLGRGGRGAPATTVFGESKPRWVAASSIEGSHTEAPAAVPPSEVEGDLSAVLITRAPASAPRQLVASRPQAPLHCEQPGESGDVVVSIHSVRSVRSRGRDAIKISGGRSRVGAQIAPTCST